MFKLGLQDVRSLNQTRVMLEYNAGFQAAAAGLVEAPGTWEVCLQVEKSLMCSRPGTRTQ